ncbi:aldo/keto reductase [Helicobacter cholecystus]|uniref:Aldo/keto reductase n=1 Tax=Helicobacter cholecystus TaxID=45498 RepID=A0A3D8IVA0_9HELI|nr:aldo/keto reductase [Helicobacter cholecystus]RDU68930.1 aldo/keto reductase [Helicobacter cholecystus]VEJ25922.1 aldo/keto reductase [Helicobacter cholecystus]
MVTNNQILNEFYTLKCNVKIPKLGLGVWCIEDNIVENVIKEAFKIGYRHIDSAQAYENERGVGEAVRNSGIPREQIFVTSKIRAEYKDYKSAKDSIDISLKTMKLDYIDLMLIHSPQPWNDFRGGDYFEENIEVYKALEDAQKEGKVRSIGVSNFLQKDLENILKNCQIIPATNQILAHIGRIPFALIDFCKSKNILVEAYSPIAHGELLKDERIVKMAEKYNVSPAQISIRYTLELGLLPLPKSKTPSFIAQNAEVDFMLTKEDLEELKTLVFKDYGEYSHFPVFSGKQ